MGYFKLDKLDKIVISFTLIIVTMFCIFNTFCQASETSIETTMIQNLSFDVNTGYFHISNTNNIFYIPVKEGYTYKIISNAEYSDRNIGFSSEVPKNGDRIHDIFSVSPMSEKVVTVPYGVNYLFMSTSGISDIVEFYEISPLGLKGTINKLYNDVGINNLWNIFENITPYIFVVVIFSLGVWFIKHNIIEHSKGRDF